MLETVINDVAGIFRTTFLNGDMIALAIAFGSVLVASLVMRRGTQILRGYFRGAAPQATYGDRAVSQLEASWSHFMSLHAGTLLAYFIAFMFLIILLYGVRTLINR